MSQTDKLTIALAQIAPVWLDREATLAKVISHIHQSQQQNPDLIVFGEALVPGYPYWPELTDGARFNAENQKVLFAHYSEQAVVVEHGHLDGVCEAAKHTQTAVYLGTIERAPDRSGHSLYCTMIYIDKNGQIGSTHRKLMPTYEERLNWSSGDGHGLRVHSLGAFTVGGLNCWENWMPLPRAALYGQGEDLHVAIWPGGCHNTHDITPFIAKEGRSYSVAVCGLMRPSDIPTTTPFYDEMIKACQGKAFLSNGASCVAAPDGSWVVEPQLESEGLFYATIDHQNVRKERQNFDPSGHYSRPDVTQLHVNRKRQSVVKFED